MKRSQKGFTLIELVIVIVILGILSAFALPRFADLGSEAREASIEGAAGAVRSSAAITRSAWLAQGQPEAQADGGDGTNPAEVDLDENDSVQVSDNGYPIASTDFGEGILFAAQLTESDYDASGGLTIRLADQSDNSQCQFEYDESNGQVDVITTGC